MTGNRIRHQKLAWEATWSWSEAGKDCSVYLQIALGGKERL
ncbi:hypothetical protein ABIE27_005447 [Paenibacillus sp. 4624]